MKSMKLYGITTSALALLLVAMTARAVIIDPIAATANSELVTYPLGAGYDRRAIHTIDSSGLTMPGNVIVGNSHATGADNIAWLSSGSGPISSVYIDWDLGGVFSITGFHLWNYNAEVARGVKYATIEISNDPTFTVGVTTITDWSSGAGLTEAPGNPAYVGENYTFSPAAGQYVRFANLTTWGDASYVGLSEIRFIGELVPEPSTVALLGMGGFVLWRRRR